MASSKSPRPRPTPVLAGDSAGPPPPRRNGEFNLRTALFEIAIVAVGVLLALIVDEARQSGVDRALASEARTAMRAEIDQNRIRLAAKLALLHQSYRALEADPAAGPSLVQQRSNFQIMLTDAAWVMAAETGALPLLDEKERQSLAYVYTSHEIYNELLAEEMKHWTALAASTPGDTTVPLWKAYAHRVAAGVCIAAIRIERFRNPALPAPRLQQSCQRYRLSVPPGQLCKELGFRMPDTGWRPGSDF